MLLATIGDLQFVVSGLFPVHEADHQSRFFGFSSIYVHQHLPRLRTYYGNGDERILSSDEIGKVHRSYIVTIKHIISITLCVLVDLKSEAN